MSSADFLEWGTEWLSEVRETDISQTIAYTRTNVGTAVGLAATKASDRHTVEQGIGVHLQEEEDDFIIKKSVLTAALQTLGATITDPLQGDLIVWNGVTYMVANRGSEPAARDHGRYDLDWRIHADEVVL